MSHWYWIVYRWTCLVNSVSASGAGRAHGVMGAFCTVIEKKNSHLRHSVAQNKYTLQRFDSIGFLKYCMLILWVWMLHALLHMRSISAVLRLPESWHRHVLKACFKKFG